MDHEVVHPGRRDVVPQPLEMHRVIPRGLTELMLRHALPRRRVASNHPDHPQ